MIEQLLLIVMMPLNFALMQINQVLQFRLVINTLNFLIMLKVILFYIVKQYQKQVCL